MSGKWNGSSLIELIIGILISNSLKIDRNITVQKRKNLVPPKHFNFSEPKLIGDGLKIVLFGDSITAGLNTWYGYGTGGNFKKEVSGLGYGEFLARYLEVVEPGCIKDFKNFAITGSTIDHWLFLLEVKENNGQVLSNMEKVQCDFNGYKITTTGTPLQVLYNYMVQRTKESPFTWARERLVNLFGTNSREINAKKFLDAAQNADEIFFTLGANDVFASGIFRKAIETIRSGLQNWPEVRSELITIWKLVEENLQKVFARLRELNPNASINIVSYPLSLLRLVDWLDSELPIPEEDGFSHFFDNGLNGAIRGAVIKFNGKQGILPVNFLDVFEEEKWFEYAAMLDEDPFSIHPTIDGYQEMGRMIFCKITQEQAWVSVRDTGCYKQQIKTQKSDEELSEIVKNYKFANPWTLGYDESVVIAKDYLWWHVRKAPNFYQIWKAIYDEHFTGNDLIRQIMGIDTEKTWKMWFQILVGEDGASDLFSKVVCGFVKETRDKNKITRDDWLIFLKKMLAKNPVIIDLLVTLFDNDFLYNNWNLGFSFFLQNVLGLDGLEKQLDMFYELTYNTIGRMVNGAKRSWQEITLDKQSIHELIDEQIMQIASIGNEMGLIMEVAQLLPHFANPGAERDWFRIIIFTRYVMAKFNLNSGSQIERFIKMTLKRAGIKEEIQTSLLEKWFSDESNEIINGSIRDEEKLEQLNKALLRGEW